MLSKEDNDSAFNMGDTPIPPLKGVTRANQGSGGLREC